MIEENKIYGRLEVIRFIHRIKGHNYHLCKCSCGKEVTVMEGNLKQGFTKSCGCLRKEVTANKNKTHGYTKHSLYGVWCNMKERCYAVTCDRYMDYGGRGITICDVWLNDAKEFIEWCLYNGWKKGLQIDRENNDSGYCPSNCRFVTPLENNKNTRLIRSNNTSGYRGVSYHKATRRWYARTSINSKRINIGLFSNKVDAAVARDSYVISNSLHLPLNFPV